MSEEEDKLKDHISSYLVNGDEQFNNIDNDNDDDDVGSDDSSKGQKSGYVLLSQSISDDEGEGNRDSNTNLEINSTESHLNTRSETPEQGIGLRLLPPPPPISMEESEIEAVRQAMTGFTLPISSTPDWALSVPEDIWKKELLDGLRKRTQSNT